MVTETFQTESPVTAEPDSSATPRIVTVLLFALPAIVYLTVYSINARLNRGVIERHYGWQVWNTMSQELPDAAYPGLLRASFWLLVFVFVAGFLAMLWFALMSTPDDEASLPANDLENPETSLMLTEHVS